MSSIRSILKAQQPEIYEQLVAGECVQRTEKPAKILTREVKDVMRHDSFKRTRGGIKQVG